MKNWKKLSDLNYDKYGYKRSLNMDVEDGKLVEEAVMDIVEKNIQKTISEDGSELRLSEQSVAPSDLEDGTECRVYLKDDKFIIQYNDGGTIRYKYLGLTTDGVLWTHTTVAP